MFKGLVIKLTNQYAVVLTEDNQYLQIRRKEGLAVGQKIYFFEEDIQVPQKAEAGLSRGTALWQKVLSSSVLAASLLFFFVFGNLFWLPSESQAYYAVVSVDINPSLELTINQERIVVKVEALNQEGYQVGGQYLVGQKIEAALESIVEKAAKYHYLIKQDTILLAAAVNPQIEPRKDITGEKNNEQNMPENTRKENARKENTQKLISELMQADLPEEYSYVYLSADQEEYTKAKENKLSLGKYEMMVLTDHKIEPEEIKKMKVKELLEEPEIKAELSENKPSKRVWLEDSYQQIRKKLDERADNGKDKNKDKEDRNKEDQNNEDRNKGNQNNSNLNEENPNKGDQNYQDRGREDKTKEVFRNEQPQKDSEKRSNNQDNRNTDKQKDKQDNGKKSRPEPSNKGPDEQAQDDSKGDGPKKEKDPKNKTGKD